MLRFTANISFLFTELPFLERFEAAHRAGFDAVECHWPYEFPVETLRAAIERAGVRLTGINTAPGDTTAGEFGLAAVPGREAEFDAHFDLALTYAAVLSVPMIHVMAGTVGEAGREAAEATFIANLKRAAEKAETAGVTLLIEPINGRDRPNYALTSCEQAARIIEAVGAGNVKLMFDVYHIQILQGDVVTRFKTHLPIIGHVQIAAVPDRGEPDSGEIDYPYVIGQIAKAGYAGLIGAEYKPRRTTDEGLSWAWAYGVGRTGNPE